MCDRAETDDCATDYDCPEQNKCCYCHCAMHCVEAAEETPATCPAITVVCPMVDPTNRCEKERKCPENKKCCDTGCGKDCVWPQKGPISNTSVMCIQLSASLPAPWIGRGRPEDSADPDPCVLDSPDPCRLYTGAQTEPLAQLQINLFMPQLCHWGFLRLTVSPSVLY
ncbi:waprin-Phi1-like [Gopherus evgoodei]|uniref:waprin-Phi1-like n=1 Tax=Gopherus evgoodei TaxID=1825980 RepID=UPI0011CFD61F|nr:waprin-Phi1-like [Gopherus evgoodei]